MSIVAARGEEVRQRQLHRRAGGERAHQLQPLDALRMLPRRDPADAKTRHQAFGKRAAVQHAAAAIPVFRRMRRLSARPEFGVNVILDQRHLIARQQRHQLRLARGRERDAKRILQRGHQPARFYRPALQRLFQLLHIDAVLRVTRHRERFELESLDRLQRAIEGRLLNHHVVAGLGQRLQAEIERFQRAVGDDDLIRRERDALPGVALRQHLPQRGIAGRKIIQRVERRQLMGDVGQRAHQLALRKELGIGKSGAKGDDRRIADRLQHVEDKVVDIDLLAERHLRRRGLQRARGDVVAGLGPRDNPALALQHLVGVHHRHQAQPVLRHLLTQRRQLCARRPDARLDLLLNLIRQLLIFRHGLLLLLPGRSLAWREQLWRRQTARKREIRRERDKGHRARRATNSRKQKPRLRGVFT